MGAVALPYNPQPGEPEDITQIMANLNAILAQVNGNLESAVNVRVAAAGPLTGEANTEGGSASLARADHAHIVRGVEQLAAEPTTGHFVGRKYFNTSSGKAFICTAVSPATYVPYANIAADDLVTHAARHASGGADALPNGAVSNAMLGRTFVETVLAANVALVDSAFTDIVSVTFTCAGSQVVSLVGAAGWTNSGTAQGRVGLSFWEGTSELAGQRLQQVSATGGANDQGTEDFALVRTFSDGSHTVKLRAWKDGGANADVTVYPTSVYGGKTFNPTRIQALVG